jgi:hypothetical protein
MANTSNQPAAGTLFDQKEELKNYLNALPYRMLTEFYSEEAVDAFLTT